MLNRFWKLHGCRPPFSARCGLFVIAVSTMLFMFLQSACFVKKNKVQITPASAVRIAILPFNVPPGNQDLRWAAMAGPILMAKAGFYAKDLEVLPLWQTMPTAIEAAGESRNFTPETAANVASYLNVKWTAVGELNPSKAELSIVLDFIPPRSTAIAFRFSKSGKIDALGSRIPEAFSQFLRYLAVRPLDPAGKDLQTMTSLKSLAEALDREYGWYAEADPGKAQQFVTELMRTDEKLARFLFNPDIYQTKQ